MRYAVLAMVVLITGGCAAQRPATAQTVDPRLRYIDTPTTALAFGAPVTLGQSPVVLDRELREPGVFLGYEDLIATYYYIRNDDWQIGTNDGRLYRRAVSERVGVTYR